jgi:hypothetical protein
MRGVGAVSGLRYFELHRDRDVSGVSGEGVVADGFVVPFEYTMLFPTGTRTMPPEWVVLVWRGTARSIVIWPSLGAATTVHGHDGATRIVWVDRPNLEHDLITPPRASSVLQDRSIAAALWDCRFPGARPVDP